MSKKRSFFERLTGTVNIDDDELSEIEDSQRRTMQVQSAANSNTGNAWMEEAAGEGELAIDVYETPDDVIVRTMIPGVKRDEVDVSLSRDSVTIRGQRKEDRTISEQDFHFRELYWGTFSRTINLPHEVDVDRAEATEAQGVLTIKLPRIDKGRKTKLRVKSV
jgi:HSP20 family protein